MSLGDCLRERAQGGIWTVLAVDEADRVPAEVFEMLDEAAGMEPMLQIVLIGREGFLDTSAHVEASRLRLRVRRSKSLRAEPSAAGAKAAEPGTVEHIPVDSAPVEPAPADPVAFDPVVVEPVAVEPVAVEPTAVESVAADAFWTDTGHRGVDASPVHAAPDDEAVPSLASLLDSSDQPASESLSATGAHPSCVAGGRVNPTPRPRDRDPFREAMSALTLDTPKLLPVLSDPHSVHAEWFRVLRQRVDDWLRERVEGSRSVVVTGSEVSAGKTFVSANLALLWAASTGDRVLVVDGDLRRPQFHTLFEIPRSPGLADVLSGRARLEESSAFVSEVGLHVMSAGRPGNPRHLVNPDRVRQALDSMRSAFDIVIFDSPPLSGLVDSRSFAAAADGVLMVVRAGETRLPSLNKAIECLPGNNLIGAVVNAATAGVDSAYSQYQRAARR